MAITGIDMESNMKDRVSSYLDTFKPGKGQVPSFQDSLKAATDGQGKIRSKEVFRPEKRVPYSNMAKDGIIQYNGVVFVCDYEMNSLCLGDMTKPDKVLSIPLSGGGVLKVNRDDIDSLARAIGMFSPEDVNLIMRALAQDAQCSRKMNEIEDMKSEVGEEKVKS